VSQLYALPPIPIYGSVLTFAALRLCVRFSLFAFIRVHSRFVFPSHDP